jgi:uncharacterized surface protein with fasciclin (FAS1) repeats
MKKQNLRRMLNLRSFVLAGIFAFAVLAVSCSKEDDGYLPETVESEELKSGKAVKKGELSIAEIALADDGEFDELVAALLFVDSELNAGLVNLFLNGKDQFTVFAPTDAAFEALYLATGVTQINELPATLVLDVLKYHVTTGRRAANSVVPKTGTRTIETLLEGATFSVDTMAKITAGSNSANIVAANISASNGVIHVIDTVILP